MIQPSITLEKQCRVNNSFRVSFHCQSHEEIYFYSWMKNSNVNSFYFSLNDRLLSFPWRNEEFFFLFFLFPRRLINTIDDYTLIDTSRFLDFKLDFQSLFFLWVEHDSANYHVRLTSRSIRAIYEVYFWIKMCYEINFKRSDKLCSPK